MVIRTTMTMLAAAAGLLATLPVVLLGLPFWFVGGATRAVRGLLGRVRGRALPWRRLMAYEPVVGWKPKPGIRARGRAARPYRIVTDAEGWRGRATLEESDVVVLGDSFAFGHGADERVLYANQHPRLRIKPVGTNGYSMVHGLLWLERLAPRLRGKTVVWFVYYGNDLYENLRPNLDRYRMPFVRQRATGAWEVVTRHVGPEPWPCPRPRRYLARLAEISSDGPLAKRVFSACGFLIDRARAVCTTAGAALVVVGVPSHHQLSPEGRAFLRRCSPEPEACDPLSVDRRLRAVCAERDVRFVALSEHLGPGDYSPDDGHWTARGHRRVAALLGHLVETEAEPVAAGPAVGGVRRPAGVGS